MFVAKNFFLTKGVGKHRTELKSKRIALRDAGLAHYNLVGGANVLPPNCKLIPFEEGRRLLSPGQILFSVISMNATNEPGQRVTAAVGVAMPIDRSAYGYVLGRQSFNESSRDAGKYVERLAVEMLAADLSARFDLNPALDPESDPYTISSEIIVATNIAESAIDDEDGLWTTIVAGAVFIP